MGYLCFMSSIRDSAEVPLKHKKVGDQKTTCVIKFDRKKEINMCAHSRGA